MRRRHGVLVAVSVVSLFVFGLLVAGCGTPPPSNDATSRLVGTINVYAPTSFTDIMGKLTSLFAGAHPGVDVRPTFGPDSALVGDAADATGTPIVITQAVITQAVITQGPGKLTGLAAGTAAVPLASNQIVMAVGLGDPKAISDPSDLARTDLRVALCAEAEPCGAASAAVLTAAGAAVPTAIRVADTRAALAQVEQGTADAALVYRTDTRASKKVDTVEFPQSQAAIVRYQAAAPAGHGDPGTAKIFLDFLASAPVQEALAGAGFQPGAP